MIIDSEYPSVLVVMKKVWWITAVLFAGLLSPRAMSLGEADRCMATAREQAYDLAIVFCTVAAEGGNEKAGFILGDMYEQGKGVPRDEVKAFSWYELAASQGDKDAEQKLILLEKRLTSVQLEKARVLSGQIGKEPTGSALAPSPADGLNGGERFSGVGLQVTPEFFLSEGLYVVSMQHDGGNNFIVQPRGADGRYYLPLANVIGPFVGSAVFYSDQAKAYKLSVNANGTWNVGIKRPDKGGSLRKFAGKGRQVTEVITLGDGVYVVEMKHGGSSNFSVRPYTALGEGHVSLVNVIGPFDGARTRPFSEGDYLFQVDADGDWELSITKQ